MTRKEAFVVIVFNTNQTFFEFFNLSSNSLYELPDNGLWIEVLTYSVFIDSIIQPITNLIIYPIKNFLKRFVKTIFRTNYCLSSRIEKNTGANSLSVFSLYLLNKTFSVIWYSKPLISCTKSLNKFLILGLLIVNWTDGSLNPLFQCYNFLHIL